MKLHQGLLSVSDFAAYCGSTRQTMQYYDRIGLLDPIQVGSQGYRYYHPLQGHEVRLIRSLQQSGCSLDEIKEILYSTSIETLQEQVAAKQRALELEAQRIRRVQIYLTRLGEFMSWAASHPLDTPELVILKKPLHLHEITFQDPSDLYSDHYYQILLRYADFCAKNGSSIQDYPYFFYVSPAEIRGGLRFSKLLCVLEDTALPEAPSFTAPPGKYLTMLCRPDKRSRNDHRKAIYQMLLRYMEDKGLKPLGGSVELPFCIPPGMRHGDYRFEVVFIMPVASADRTKEGGEAE